MIELFCTKHWKTLLSCFSLYCPCSRKIVDWLSITYSLEEVSCEDTSCCFYQINAMLMRFMNGLFISLRVKSNLGWRKRLQLRFEIQPMLLHFSEHDLFKVWLAYAYNAEIAYILFFFKSTFVICMSSLAYLCNRCMVAFLLKWLLTLENRYTVMTEWILPNWHWWYVI